MRNTSHRLIITACVCLVVALVVLVRVVNSSRDVASSAAQPTAVRPADSQSSTALDQGLPVLTISDVKVPEGNNGITEVPFTVSLNHPSEQPVSVVYTTSDGSATAANGDFIANRGTLTFLPGEMSKIITIQIGSGAPGENDKLFQVTLSNALHATIGTATATGTIANDGQVAVSEPTSPPTFPTIRATDVLPVPTNIPTPTPAPTVEPTNAPSIAIRPVTVTNGLYLPWIQRLKHADLLIDSIELYPNTRTIVAGSPVEIRVTIHNAGDTSITTPFWVDLYVNPARTPQANTPWNTVCGMTPCQGVTWHVTQPLGPDERLTLTTMQPEHTHTVWEGWLPNGTTTIAAYVDSWDAAGSSGAVQEDNENNNETEIKDLSVTGTNPPSLEGPASQVQRRP